MKPWIEREPGHDSLCDCPGLPFTDPTTLEKRWSEGGWHLQQFGSKKLLDRSGTHPTAIERCPAYYRKRTFRSKQKGKPAREIQFRVHPNDPRRLLRDDAGDRFEQTLRKGA